MAFGLALATQILQAQNDDKTVYGNLETKRFYDVNMGKSGSGSKITYTVNDGKVDKETYDKYHDTWQNFETCCPCILQTYDINDVLQTEAVSCTDCLVGFYFEFHENGVTKIKGHCKENPTGNWSDIFKRGYCSVKDGIWEYFNEQGEIFSIETWKDGDFVEQKPKGDKPEIWRIDLTANNEKIKDNQLEMSSLKSFEIIPQYKNEHRSKRLQATISASTSTNKNKRLEMPMATVNADKLKHLVAGLGAKTGDRLSMEITIYDDREEVQTLYLNVISK
jgi:antitoxin component YwqK of YwqJK toxin-antitoxin module